MNPNKDCDDDVGDGKSSPSVEAEASMNTLILWNISKALQRNPHLDLRTAINQAHHRLDNTCDVNKLVSRSPEERHLSCALLAWQELGHSTADSLYRFIEDRLESHMRNECERMTLNTKIKIVSPSNHNQTLKQKNNITLNCPECTHTANRDSTLCSHKDKEEPKLHPGTHTRKAEVTMSNDSSHPECSYLGNKKNTGSQLKKVSKTSLANFSDNIEQNKSNDSTPCNRILKEVSCCIYDSANQSIDCVIKDKNKTEHLNCPFMSAAYDLPLNNTDASRPIQHDSCADLDTNSLKGPVVTLPPETKVVMRFDDTQSPCARHQGKKPKEKEKDIMRKIDAACCMDSACAERLTELDNVTTELRNRAARLARREAERAELLERAEAAWKDLELGYQRRLILAEEKEYDMAKQTKKLIEDRNGYKTACTNLAKVLKDRGETTEKKRQDLLVVEKEMCALACIRMKLSEGAARSDAAVNEQQIKVSQLDRDLRFKEEQTRRKLLGAQGEVDSVQALAIEAERAMRSELAALRSQIDTVSKQLLREDDDNKMIKAELDSIRAEKLGMVDDLEGCQVTCDSRMQKKMDDLIKARERLTELKDKVMECKCKIPIDTAVEVKRTPSLAALCSCAPEDRLLESCSCTSLRSQLLSNLLSDLFGGLQADIGDVAAQMPCQYLKCLEDKHDWNKTTVVKSNLRSYFSKLLVGELDIAIATAIEKYHARWVGASCVDTMRSIPDTSEAAWNQGWQERAIERRAQKLANKLAEQLFKERADQLVQRAKDSIKSGPLPCECKETAVFPCFVNPPTIGQKVEDGTAVSSYWRKTYKDVSQLRTQIEDLKKETLKKEDFKLMEEKIFKLVQRPSEPESPANNNTETMKCNNRSISTEGASKYQYPAQSSKPALLKKKNLEANISIKRNSKKTFNEQPSRLNNKNNRKAGLGQSFAVNTCICANKNNIIGEDIISRKSNAENDNKGTRSILKIMSDQVSGSKLSKPISVELELTAQLSPDVKKNDMCPSDCVCFHKLPSNTSIDKLLEQLSKWKSDLTEVSENFDKSKIMTNFDLESILRQSDELHKSSLGIQSNSIYQVSAPKLSDNIINNDLSTDVNTSILPNVTESEYMGAINLDKSNYQCQCFAKQQKLYKDVKDQKIQDQNSLFKCIDSALCECKKSVEKNKETVNIVNKNSWQVPPKRASGISQKLVMGNKTKHSEMVLNKSKIEPPEFKTIINHTADKSEVIPYECDYYIKLLGVTLANISSHKVFDGEQVNRKHITEAILNEQGNINSSTNKSKIDNDEQIIKSCQCHVQFDELKNYMENNFKKQRGDHLTEDKELDVPSFRENSLKDDESCVCCNNSVINDSQELEVNTFYLLEKYLRGRLEELKKSCCKFSSLPADEEEKLFSAILKRVKQIISSSTYELTCKCKEGKHSDGSLNRANILLQEYLKTKIKKVQCLCANDDGNHDCILPNVLHEIYSLIDKDFQRLRNVYKFHNTNNVTENNRVDQDEVPEKDTSSNEMENFTQKIDISINSKPEKVSKSNSNNSMILKESMWAQVPINLGMNTKSCDAMERGIKNVQTSESIKSVRERGNNSVENSTKNSYSYGTPNILVNHHVNTTMTNNYTKNSKNTNLKSNVSNQNVAKKNNDGSSSPYIGYTVDCSCKCALGTCTCIKSTVMKNNEKITNLWNDLTKDKVHSHNYSYIMNSIPKKNKSKPVTNIDTKSWRENPSFKNKISKTVESDFDGEEIILKGSPNHNVAVTNNFANTFSDKIYDNVSKREETDDIWECHSIKPILKNSIRSESHLPNSINMHKTQSLSCDCNMVPVCHVKMLVDSIEHRIYHSKCTCDSFSARVCPIHSKLQY